MVKLGDQNREDNKMVFAWILIILLIIISSFLCWVIYLMTQQIEQYEENVEYYQNWYDKFITIIADADTKMKEVDNKGSFSSDDEIGFAYQTVKECINQLTEMGVITYERQEDGQTDSSEEIQGQEEEE